MQARLPVLKIGSELSELENVLHHLNYRWSIEALALWKGDAVPFEPYRIYEGFDDFISLDTLSRIEKIESEKIRTRLRHALIDHYLQKHLLPHDNEMRTWMKGAAARVNGEKIYIREIIPWCRKSSTYQTRQILQKETRSLSRFLKPFALNHWNLLIDRLRDDLGFADYLDYCGRKKGIDYFYYYRILKHFLRETDALYFHAMEGWSKDRFGRPMAQLTRFDAINLLDLGQFDDLFSDVVPGADIEALTRFFHYWQIDLKTTPGLNLELGKEPGKSAQAICIILEVPEEVYILMRPEGGWIDLETLWHELGHGLSAVSTSPGLSIVDREMATSYSLSETYAFLLQNLAISSPFLEGFLGLSLEDCKRLSYHKALKDFSVFRRYAAKFIVEFEMFSADDLANGDRYASLMTRYTGFSYLPDGHLFDLVPEFYCLDYLLGWMGEAILEDHLRGRLGADWMFQAAAGDILKDWWVQGNRYDIFRFFDQNGLEPLTLNRLLTRWEMMLG
jgi:hypothetical protein